MFLYYYVFRNFPTRKQHFISTLSLVQGAYFFLTGMWPIIDIHSFMLVTGPKEDIWLVKTVGALTIAISLVLFMVSKKRRIVPESMVLILGSGLAYLIIDVVFSLKGVIGYIYLGDAALQILFMGIWVYWLIKIRFRLQFKHY